eukprot:3070058-Lingulodinium_polyedra.AAC.1
MPSWHPGRKPPSSAAVARTRGLCGLACPGSRSGPCPLRPGTSRLGPWPATLFRSQLGCHWLAAWTKMPAEGEDGDDGGDDGTGEGGRNRKYTSGPEYKFG